MGSVVGSVLGGVLLTVLVELTKEMKFSIEIAFGGLLIVFVLFQPQGLVMFFKKWLPGWVERLHYLPRDMQQQSAQPEAEAEPGPGPGPERNARPAHVEGDD